MNREEIIEYVKEETRIKTTRTTTICQNNIDQVQDLHIANNIYEHEFNFLKEYGYLNLVPIYETGKVEMVQDSKAVVGTLTVWISSHVGWILKVAGADEYYEVASVEGNTTLTLKSEYIGSSDTGLSYVLYKVFYSLGSDFDSMRWIKQIDTPTRVDPLEDLAFQDLVPNDFTPSGEVYGYIVGSIVSDVMQIRLVPIQTERKRFYYCYNKQLATLNATGLSSIIPSKWHWLFVYKLSEIVFKAHDMRQKSFDMKAEFNSLLKTFINIDLAMTRDRRNVVADESLYKGDRHPYARLPSQYSPDL